MSFSLHCEYFSLDGTEHACAIVIGHYINGIVLNLRTFLSRRTWQLLKIRLFYLS